MAYRAVLLDLDGLLVDTEALLYEIDLRLFEEMGVPRAQAEPFMEQIIGTVEAEIWRRLEERFPEIDRAKMGARRKELVDAAYAGGIPVIKGVLPFLDALDVLGLKRAVATNSSSARAALKLERSGLAHRVDAVIAHDDVASPKPAPDVYRAAAHALGADPAQCLAFDDSDTGAQSAKAAGCTVVQVPNMQPSDGPHADYVASDLWTGALKAGLPLPSPTEDS